MSPRGFVAFSLAWLLVGSILIVAGGELFVAHGGEDCEDHCDDSCQGCGDCVMCPLSLHMIAWNGFEFTPTDLSPGWAVRSLSSRIAGPPANDIDHPPQNLA